MKKLTQLSFYISLLIGLQAEAAPLYEGHLFDASSNPITTAVMIKLDVQSSDGTCSLFKETHSVTPNSTGYFSVQIGAGSNLFKANNPAGMITNVDQAFQNQINFTGFSSCAYTPTVAEGRKLQVWVSADSGSTWDNLGSVALQPQSNSVFASVAQVSEVANKVGSFGSANLLRVDNAGTPGPASSITSPQFTELLALINGSSIQYQKPSANGTTALPSFASDPGGMAPGQLWYDSSVQKLKYYNGSTSQQVSTGVGGAGTVTSVAAGTGLVAGTITTSGTISVDTCTSANKIVQLDGSARLPIVDGSLLTSVNAGFIKSTQVSPVTPFQVGQTLRYNGTMYVADIIQGVDIKSNVNAPFFPGACGVGQVMNYNAVSDSIQCTAFVVPNNDLVSPVTYYVRSDGNNNCTGLFNSGGASGSCAFATIQKALDTLPNVINAVAIIDLGAQVLTLNQTNIINKNFKSNGQLIIQNGTINTNAATSSFAPIFTTSGNSFSGGVPSIQFSNLIINETIAASRRELFMLMGMVYLRDLTINNAQTGLSVHNGHVMLDGVISISLANGIDEARAISVDGGASVEFMGSGNMTITLGDLGSTNKRQSGISVGSGGTFRSETSGTVNIVMHGNNSYSMGTQGTGFDVSGGSVEIKSSVNINTGNAIGNLPIQIYSGEFKIEQSSMLNITNISDKGGINIMKGGVLSASGPVSIAGNSTNSVISLEDGAKAVFYHNLTLNNSAGSPPSLVGLRTGSIFKFAPYSGANFNITGGTTTYLFSASLGSLIEVGTSGPPSNYSASGTIVKLAQLDSASTMVLQGSTGGANWPALSGGSAIAASNGGRFINSTSGPWGPASVSGGAAAQGMMTFNSTQSWNVPMGVTAIKVSLIGGGAGAYSAGMYFGGQGGAGFGYLQVAPGALINITVGNGGNGGAPGTNGAFSEVNYSGSWIRANGGIAAVASGAQGSAGNITDSGGAANSVMGNFTQGNAGSGGPTGGGAGQNGFVLIEW